jgi:HD-GYP domain-containing protein (c-di-GMP phosphodiesterase class II)
MIDPVRFLTSFVQSLSTMALYGEKHPARDRAVDRSFEALRELQTVDSRPQFTFLGEETVYGQVSLREMRDWEWAARLANAGVQRLEFEPDVTRDEYEEFLDEVLARLALTAIDTSEMRTTRRTTIKFGAIGVRGESRERPVIEARMPVPGLGLSLHEEAAAIEWLHGEVGDRGKLPLAEAEAVVRSLSLAMHGESEMMLPLLEMREFDEYTTTHSLNVAVLTMALAEHLGLSAREVRNYGVAGLLHDLGKVRVPLEILNKPGKLTASSSPAIASWIWPPPWRTSTTS